MAAEDKTIVCVDCKQEFVHTAEDQARYAERGFTNEPKRCRPCREARKAKQGAPAGGGGGGGQAPAPRPPRQPIGGGMGGGPRRDFGGGGGGRGFGGGGPRRDFGGGGGGRGNFGDRPRGPRQMFPAVCAECGKQTEVPFKPSGDRPVLCRDCFRASRGG